MSTHFLKQMDLRFFTRGVQMFVHGLMKRLSRTRPNGDSPTELSMSKKLSMKLKFHVPSLLFPYFN